MDTVQLKAIIYDQEQQPVSDARVIVVLDRFDQDINDKQYILPRQQSLTTDANGEVLFYAWKNSEGVRSSSYVLQAFKSGYGELLSVTFTVPENAVDGTNVMDIATIEPFPSKSEYVVALEVVQAEVLKAEAARDEAELSASAAAASEAAAAQTATETAQALQEWENTVAYAPSGDFDSGFTATMRTEIYLYQGEWYRWDGALPKTVAASETPASSGGIGSGAWLSVGDAALRQDITENGVKSVYVRNDGEPSPQPGALTVTCTRNASNSAIATYNSTGVQSDGSHSRGDGKSSQIWHHYNDDIGLVLDYCGRGGKASLIRMAYNASASGHNETGSGYFQVFERTVINDPDFTAPSNRSLAAFKQLNLADVGLSVDDRYVFGIQGRDATLTGALGESYIENSIYFITYGNSSNNGDAAVRFYSNSFGGHAAHFQTRSTSVGSSINVVHQAPGKDAVVVDNMASGVNNSFISISRDGAAKTHYDVRQITNNQTSGYGFRIRNAAAELSFGIAIDGKRIFMRDRGDGSLKTLSIVNGVLTIE